MEQNASSVTILIQLSIFWWSRIISGLSWSVVLKGLVVVSKKQILLPSVQ